MVLSADAAARPLRALVAGTGSIGRRHIANLSALAPGADFALLRDGAREDDYSRQLGAATFGGIGEALAWAPDLAVIATPSDRHHELLAPLLAAGVATLVEKPVVIAGRDADALDALLTGPAAGVPTQTGCVLRFLPAVRTLKRWLEAGRCGQLVHASLQAGQYLPDWRPRQDYRRSYSARTERGGGVIFDLVHELDLALWLFGEAELLCAAHGKASRLEIESDDAALLTLRAAGNVLIGIALDYVSRRPVRTIEIVGDEATARLDFIARELVLVGPDGPLDVVRDGFDLDEAYRAELAELIAAVQSGAPTSLPVAEGLRATRLAIAAQAA